MAGMTTITLPLASSFASSSLVTSLSKPSIIGMRRCVVATPRSRTRFSKIYALTRNDIKVGINVEVDGAPWKVLEGRGRGLIIEVCLVMQILLQLDLTFSQFAFIEFLHVKPGKGAAFVRTKMRDYMDGNTVDKTFRSGISVIDFEAPITVKLTVVDINPGVKCDTAQGKC
ncbi:hypothetical protein Nepgr_011874 [Nepenthes gracilis]|uniref:Translation elongation factor KOW-like domain-containing protein n=1 Tax=Nepenthes gracilis TaxID=150966 RepID=A0AAD3XMA7_NEPGR|nr:hypothetical protein Nepgr_011874 [Nepenthes gracilis]